jgi:hypothetical protein
MRLQSRNQIKYCTTMDYNFNFFGITIRGVFKRLFITLSLHGGCLRLKWRASDLWIWKIEARLRSDRPPVWPVLASLESIWLYYSLWLSFWMHLNYQIQKYFVNRNLKKNLLQKFFQPIVSRKSSSKYVGKISFMSWSPRPRSRLYKRPVLLTAPSTRAWGL